MNTTKRKIVWISLGVIAVIIRFVVGQDSSLVEQFYSRGLFIYIRKALDFINSISFFPVVYLLLFIIILKIIQNLVRLFRSKLSWQKALLSIAAFLSGTIFFFLLLWGFNYARIPLEQQLDLKVEPLSAEELKRSLQVELYKTASARNEFRADSTAVSKSDLPEELKLSMRADLEVLLKEFGYPTDFNVKAQKLYPKGILLRFSTLGVYFPWTGECNVDAGLHPLEQPFVFAHELAHGYGITDEGTCNFLAYLTCIRSDNALVRYAGHFEYFTTLAYNYRRYQPSAIRELFPSLPKNIRADWEAVIENHRLYPNIMPRLRNATYNTYLRVQGIEEGIQNYNRVLMLIKAYDMKMNE